MKRLLPLLLLAACADLERSPQPAQSVSPAKPAASPDTGRSRKAEQALATPSVTPKTASKPRDGTSQLESLGYTERDKEGENKQTTLSLSNDDSMSLASAQRVLWSVAEGQRVSPDELRPHEFLNYFSFAASDIKEGARFGVAASAVRDQDALTLALTVTGASPQRDPMDLTLVIDRSGSMKEEGRMDYVKRGLVRMVDRLHAEDRVNVVVFDDDATLVREGFVVGRDDLDDLCLLFENIRPEGATDLNEALQLAYQTARNKPTRGHDARVLLVTDARITAGELSPDRVTEIGRAFDESGVRLAAIGVGRDFDDEVLQELTEKGHGAYVYLGSEKVVDRVFGSGFDSLLNVIAEDVRFDLTLPPSLAMKRFYGEEMSTHRADVDPVSFHAGNTQVFLQDLNGNGSGSAAREPIRLDISWRDPDTGKAKSQRWEGTLADALERPANVEKARALMAWTDLVRVGRFGCRAEKTSWSAKNRAFGGDTETRYLDGLVKGWCPETEDSQSIAEAE